VEARHWTLVRIVLTTDVELQTAHCAAKYFAGGLNEEAKNTGTGPVLQLEVSSFQRDLFRKGHFLQCFLGHLEHIFLCLLIALPGRSLMGKVQ
jgi:hypothetical protein